MVSILFHQTFRQRYVTTRRKGEFNVSFHFIHSFFLIFEIEEKNEIRWQIVLNSRFDIFTPISKVGMRRGARVSLVDSSDIQYAGYIGRLDEEMGTEVWKEFVLHEIKCQPCF